MLFAGVLCHLPLSCLLQLLTIPADRPGERPLTLPPHRNNLQLLSLPINACHHQVDTKIWPPLRTSRRSKLVLGGLRRSCGGVPCRALRGPRCRYDRVDEEGGQTDQALLFSQALLVRCNRALFASTPAVARTIPPAVRAHVHSANAYARRKCIRQVRSRRSGLAWCSGT